MSLQIIIKDDGPHYGTKCEVLSEETSLNFPISQQLNFGKALGVNEFEGSCELEIWEDTGAIHFRIYRSSPKPHDYILRLTIEDGQIEISGDQVPEELEGKRKFNINP